MKRIITYAVMIMVIATPLTGQNLVPNPSFENFTTCPPNYNMGGPLECPPWFRATGGTSDYFNACHTTGMVGVPNNVFGVQPAHTGDAYAGSLHFWQFVSNYREYLEVPLSSPMTAGTTYIVSLWYSLSSYSCSNDRLGIYLSGSSVVDYSTIGPLNLSPQLELNTGLIQDNDWHLFTNCYVASGGEQFITIGNFYPDNQTMIGTGCPLILGNIASYIYIDDVSVEAAIPPEPIELGAADQVLCPGDVINYNFDPTLGEYLWQDGSTSPMYQINAPSAYSVTLTANCLSVEDEVNVTSLEPPDPVDLGPDISLCPSDELEINLDPTLGNFLWQDGSTNSSYTITWQGNYALTISNACGEVSDDINVSFYEYPTVDFAQDTISACAGDIITFNFDPAIGDYFWQDGQEGSVYDVSLPGIYAVTVSNPCGSDYDAVVVDFTDAPVLNLGPDITICSGQVPYTIDLTANANAESYQWSDGSQGPSLNILTSGYYSVTVSNSCFQVTDSISITIADGNLTVNLPTDTIVCPGDTISISPGNITGIYLWQDGTSGQSLAITQNGTYSLTVTNACGSASDSINIVFDDQLPFPDLGPDISLCPGEQITMYAGVTGVSYLWQDGSSQDSLVVTTPGNVILTIYNDCASRSDTAAIMFNSNPPVANLPSQLNLCDGDSVFIATVVAGATYSWNTGAVTPSIYAHSAGQYILTITNSCGTDTDTTDVIYLGTSPALDLGIDQSICPGDTITFSPGINGSYLWQDGTSTPSYTSTSADTIYLMLSNACGASSDTVIVSQLPEIPILDLGLDFPICTGDTIVLEPGIPGVGYLWQDGSNGTSYEVSSGGVIILTISNLCGLANDTVVVSEYSNMLSLDLGPDIIACEGESVTLRPGIPGVMYLWQDGSTGNEFVTTSSSEVILSISNSCATSGDTVSILIEGIAPFINLGSDTVLCRGDTLPFLIDTAGVMIRWQDGNVDPERLISDAGIYTVTLSNACGEMTDTLVIQQLELPLPFDLGTDQILCPDEVITLDAPAVTAGNALKWSSGSTSPSIDIDDAGTYVLTAYNACGAETDSITIWIDTSTLKYTGPVHFTYCNGDHLILSVDQITTAEYLWDDGSRTPQRIVTSAGSYLATITSACDQLVEEFIVDEGDCEDLASFIPNIFSPNGDGINDVFTISMHDSESFSFEIWIYDRWGNTVFHSMEPDFEWKGDFNGRQLAPGVYAYLIKTERQDNSVVVSKKLKGDITLVK
ncbi:MAG: gliding motility-associated C-terminal domain-containing protein [Saprospiraceae bacterium]|nr:gliding motility-associated C-terminal domain-containing protein [Candidatus Opimibacter iunctus]